MTVTEHYAIRARSAAELVGEIELAVGDGELAPGRRLPSVRTLAAQAGLSPSTVAAALAELRRRGLVVTDGRRGTRARPLAWQPRPRAAPRHRRRARALPLPSPPLRRGPGAGRARRAGARGARRRSAGRRA